MKPLLAAGDSLGWRALAATLAVCLLSACGSSAPGSTVSPTVRQPSAPPASPTPPPISVPTASPTSSIQDVMTIAWFAPLAPGTYFIDADAEPSTPLRVVYDVPATGWAKWIGGVKFADDPGSGPEPRHVGVSITTVVNTVRDGCRDHAWADPPIGPSVDDLANALVNLAPFEVTTLPADVTVDGYSGKHLELTVPDLPVDVQGFSDCVDGHLKSWVSPMDTAEDGDAFYGYTGPGHVEEYWILDVDGTRLMIEAGRSAGSSAGDISEMRAIVDSIRIEP